MKVVLFIDNHSMDQVDISSIMFGNPGIGGTQYEMFLLANLLLDNFKDGEFIVALTHKQKGFEKPGIVVLDGFNDIFPFCNEHDIDILISRENQKFDLIDKLIKTKVIFWIHNFISYDFVKKIGKAKQISRVIFVSKQHYDFYYEYNVNKKASYIYNCLAFPTNFIGQAVEKENNVVFTGNIVPIKKLHLVTKIWPYIVKRVPDAKLIVIGTGQNAHRDAALGPYNLAEENYEKIILKPLIEANVLDSVEFLGILGNEKNRVIQKAKIGISPNKHETFCLSAAEYILNGTPVVGVAKGGINDVVVNNKTGFLHRSLKRIKKDIVKILSGKRKITITNDEIEKMKQNFGYEVFLQSWIQNIRDVYNGKPAEKLKVSKPLLDKGKWLGAIFATLRKCFHLPECLSRLGLYKIFRRN